MYVLHKISAILPSTYQNY